MDRDAHVPIHAHHAGGQVSHHLIGHHRLIVPGTYKTQLRACYSVLKAFAGDLEASGALDRLVSPERTQRSVPDLPRLRRRQDLPDRGEDRRPGPGHGDPLASFQDSVH